MRAAGDVRALTLQEGDMNKAEHCGWIYFLARRYRSELHIGITNDLAA